jgi:hypothetical protein
MVFVSTLHVQEKNTLIDLGVSEPDFFPTASPGDEAEQDSAANPAPTSASLTSSDRKDDQPRGATAIGEIGKHPVQTEGSKTANEEAPTKPKGESFRPELTPQQVQLVDLLDAMADFPISMEPSKIAVIISAWDTEMRGRKRSPEAWLADCMPLLSQYLETHSDVFETRIYGVSAQGGHVPKREKPGNKRDPMLEEKSDREELLDKKPASARIAVVGHGSSDHDLTHPIAWLSGLDT